MIQEDTLASHYLSATEFGHFFLPNAPEADGQILAILDIVESFEDGVWVIHIILPPHLLVDKFAQNSHFEAANGEPLKGRIEPFCRGARVAFESAKKHEKIIWQLPDQSIDLIPSQNDLSLFEEKNAALIYSNGDDINTIADWTRYHHKAHNLEGICLIRATPWQKIDLAFTRKLGAKIADIPVNIMIIHTDAPLGKDAPPARSLWEAPDAPGKDRMEPPPHDPWIAELASAQIFEIMRARFLHQARAVLQISASDIIRPQDGVSIFDRCVQSKDGYIQLFGERVYPWRVRESEAVSFGDHCTHRFDSTSRNKQWCVAPGGAKKNKIWNLYRVGQTAENTHNYQNFWRFSGLRHEVDDDHNPTLAPKTALVLYEELLKFVKTEFDAKPVLPPAIDAEPITLKPASQSGRRCIVTTMKNEGPFLLEWIAFHRAIGFDDFIVYSNDCTDGTDDFLDLLQDKGLIEHYDNPFRQSGLKPQHAALFDAQTKPTQQNADWVICMDCDEFLNIKTGDGTLDALFEAIGDANMISFTWRLFGNSNVEKYIDAPIIGQFTQCANEITRFPHQAWGVKTLYRNLGFFKKMGVHRPKGLKPEYREHIKWVNGSGQALPDQFIRNGWRTGLATYGYELVQLNHYACRSMESFLVKRDRGRVNHVERDQGMIYWFRMNHNPDEDKSILRMMPKFEEEFQRLLSDPEIKAQHEACIKAHQKRIEELLATENYQKFFAEINSERVRKLSRYVPHFGMNVFMIGPDSIPDQIIHEIDDGERDYFNPPASRVVGDGH